MIIHNSIARKTQNIYIRSIIMKATSYINDAIIDTQSLKQLNIMVPYVDIIGLCHSL